MKNTRKYNKQTTDKQSYSVLCYVNAHLPKRKQILMYILYTHCYVSMESYLYRFNLISK